MFRDESFIGPYGTLTRIWSHLFHLYNVHLPNTLFSRQNETSETQFLSNFAENFSVNQILATEQIASTKILISRLLRYTTQNSASQEQSFLSTQYFSNSAFHQLSFLTASQQLSNSAYHQLQ